MSYSNEHDRVLGRNYPGDKCDRNDNCHKNEYCDEDIKVRLKSSTGGAGPLPVLTTQFAEPINVVSTTIDTCYMCHPSVWLNFTSIISLPLGISVTLNFQIYRTKEDGCPTKVGPTFTFSTLVDILESESFAFQFVDEDVSQGNFTYSVQISTNSCIDVTPGLTINNAVLTALAVSNDKYR